jgi:hypothetical protein
MRYRATRPILVLAFNDHHQLAVTVPAGTLVDVVGSAEDGRFVVVNVNDEQFHAFASDLRDRAEPVTGEIDISFLKERGHREKSRLG